MPISFHDFSGIIPKLSPRVLPDNAAQIAHHCDLCSGTLRPINIRETLQSMCGSEGKLLSEIETDDVFTIAKPDKPICTSREMVCKPFVDNWLKITVGAVGRKANRVGGIVTSYSEIVVEKTITNPRIQYTENGLRIFFNGFMLSGEYVYVEGPFFIFEFTGGKTNGPRASFSIPDTSVATSIKYGFKGIPRGAVPLEHNGDIYGQFQVVDCETNFAELRNPGVDSDGFQILHNISGRTYHFVLDVDLNYTIPKRRTFYYLQTLVKDRDKDIEGPPSEMSDKITVLPGELITMTFTSIEAGNSKRNIYRSFTGNDDFVRIEEDNRSLSNISITDFLDRHEAELLGKWGNFTDYASKESFFEGSVIHPAQFGAAFHGTTLYFSDFFKLYAWPKDFAITFSSNIMALALSGGSILVFTETHVYAVSGGNPETMAKYLLTDEPLLNKQSLCRVGNLIFYVSKIGLMMCTEGQVVNATAEYFTHREWLDWHPATMTTRTADGNIFIETDTGKHLRFDIDGALKAVSTYNVTKNPPNGFLWRSKAFHFPDREYFDYIRIQSDGATTIRVTTENETQQYTVPGNTPFFLHEMDSAATWIFEFAGTNEIRNIDVFERITLPVRDHIQLSPENVALWKSIWLKFPDNGTFSTGIAVSKEEKPVILKFYLGGKTLIHTETVASGRMFYLPILPESELWRLEAATETVIESITLFARQVVPFTGSLVEIRADSNIPPWANQFYHAPRPVLLDSVKVTASIYPVKVSILSDGKVVGECPIIDGNARRLPQIPLLRDFNIAVDEGNGIVRELCIATSMGRLGHGS